MAWGLDMPSLMRGKPYLNTVHVLWLLPGIQVVEQYAVEQHGMFSSAGAVVWSDMVVCIARHVLETHEGCGLVEEAMGAFQCTGLDGKRARKEFYWPSLRIGD
jgi:hypothetical protein